MVKPDWGIKRTCPRCATRFYDLGRDDPISCIGCGHAWSADLPPVNDEQILGGAVDDVVRQFECDTLVELVAPTLRSPDAASRLYRSHVTRPISAKEVEYRTALDQLIEMCSLLSIISGDLDAALRARNMPRDTIAEIFSHPAVNRYMTVHYPMPYGTVAFADLEGRIPKLFRIADKQERSSDAWESAIQRFLALNAHLLSDNNLLEFLFLLDDHFVAETHITELQKAFENKDAMISWLDRPERYALLEGLERMLDFSQALHDLLDDLSIFPVLRGRIWLHYSYWLGNGGARIRQTSRWLIHALESANANLADARDISANLRQVFFDLTSASMYTSQALELLSPLTLPMPALAEGS